MMDELQPAVQENLSPYSTQRLKVRRVTTLPVSNNECLVGDEICYRPDPVLDRERASKLLDELISAVKDDRMNTKRSISADIASTARVQNQNERVIDACERELRHRELTVEQREAIMDRMERATESTAAANEASRSFQEEQLKHSHNIPLRILGGFALLILGGIGGAAIAQAFTPDCVLRGSLD